MYNICDLVDKYNDEFINIRRALHMIPEASGNEYKTQKFICDYLEKNNIEHRKVVGTGVYAIIRGKNKGKTIAFRGDMDALPIEEETGLDFSSLHHKIMHACGHDAHITFLLGTAKVIQEIKDNLSGNFIFLFQPSEERFGGAKRMIEEGLLKSPLVDAVIGAHVWNLPLGTIVSKPGAIMACPDIFKIVIEGKGGHGAEPHLSVNPIIPLAKMVSVINDIRAVYINGKKPSVISVCNIHGGEEYNIIPESAYLEGTIRTYDNDLRSEIISKIEDATLNIAQAYGARGDFILTPGYPATFNNEKLSKWVYNRLVKNFPEYTVIDSIEPSMAGEDFSYFGYEVPSLFLWIGAQSSNNANIFDLHHPKFNIDEGVLNIGIKVFTNIACNFSDFN